MIKGQIQDKKLNLLILNTQNQSVKSIDGIALTGDLSEDRKQIHRLADAIHKMLFKTDGIASTRILFTIKTATSSDSSKWTSEVWESDYDGANLRQLTKDSSTCVTPIYLPPKAGYATGGFLYVSYLYGQSKMSQPLLNFLDKFQEYLFLMDFLLLLNLNQILLNECISLYLPYIF